jgi:hypothetical protein
MKQKREDRIFPFTDGCVDGSEHREDRQAGKKLKCRIFVLKLEMSRRIRVYGVTRKAFLSL